MLKEVVEKAKEFLFRRQKAYQLAFNSETGRVVLDDLARFCRAHESTFHPDPRTHAVLEGRREVWLRIQQHMQLTSDQLWKIFGRNING